MRPLCHWVFLVALALGIGSLRPARAQRTYYNWYFGSAAGLDFNASPVRGQADGQRTFEYGAASISDSLGQFLLASDGYNVWDRQWQPLPGFVNSHKPGPFSQRQVLLVRQPGPGRRYYVVRNSNQFTNGQVLTATTLTFMPVAVVDLNGRGGLGAIVAHDSIPLPLANSIQAPYLFLNTNWVAVRHANGRDVWLVGQNTDGYYLSCLLSAAGLGLPIVSRPVSLRSLSTTQDGILRASPDGRLLAVTAYTFDAPSSLLTRIELARFDPATGRVLAAEYLPRTFPGTVLGSPATYLLFFRFITGLAFSPDASKLYLTLRDQTGVYQYDLLAPTAAALLASEAAVPAQPANGSDNAADLQLGPDGNIYVIRSGFNGAARIEQANAAVPFCQLLGQAVPYPKGTASYRHTFPIPLNDLGIPPVQITAGGTVQGLSACPGEPVLFTSSLSPFVSATAFAWDFGDPAAGALNQAGGQSPVHRYASSGTYTTTVRVTTADGRQFTARQQVLIHEGPVLAPAPGTELCAGGQLVLGVGPQPTGTTYRWQDGSSAPTFRATRPGSYAVAVANAAGCEAQASWQLASTECAFFVPNVITPNGDHANDSFEVPDLNLPDWGLAVFDRWGREVHRQVPYDNRWAAEGLAGGLYYYLLSNPSTGQRLRGWVEVMK